MNGTTTATNAVTLTFPEPGIYRVEIAGPFTRIAFAGGGDRQKILQVNQWGSIEWTSMVQAFQGATNLRVPATDAPDLSGVTNMSSMFWGATVFNDPIGHWDVSKVTSFFQTFYYASSFNQPLNAWNTASATNMFRTFHSASNFNQPLDQWDVSNVTQMTQMFRSSPFNQPIGMWNTQSLKYAVEMFVDNFVFDQDLSGWDITSVENDPSGWWSVSGFTRMFTHSNTLSQANLDATLLSWSNQAVNTGVYFNLGFKRYSSVGAAAIERLRTEYNWLIAEQYEVSYSPGTNATLIGTGYQVVSSNDYAISATTTAVEIRPDRKCTFIEWSDGNTDNPRQDTLLDDNLTVSAVVTCPSGGTTLTTRIANLENNGNQAEADRLKARFNHTQATANQSTPTTIEDTLEAVRTLLDNPLLTDPESRSKTKELLSQLLELVKALSQLLVMSALTTDATEATGEAGE